jgi:lysophospholipase L1-like esterase
MQSTNQPDKVSTPFADIGVKRPIPEASQIGITDGAASFTDGFPPKTFLPLAVGGVPPAGEDFNGILFLITAIQQWQSAGGGFKYDATFATDIGGYPKGARLDNATHDDIWINTVEDNTTNPDTGGAGWVALSELGKFKATGVGSINIIDCGAKGDNSHDDYPAYVLAKTLIGSGRIVWPNTSVNIYNLTSYPNAADILEGPLLDVAEGVIINIPQALGLDATYGNGSIRVVRATRFHQSVKDVTFYASPQSSEHVQERTQWPTVSEADRASVTAIDCTVATLGNMKPKKIDWDVPTDVFVTDAFTSTTTNTAVCSTVGGQLHLGMIDLEPGEAVSASFAGYTASSIGFAIIHCEGGYYGMYGSNVNGILTTFYKLSGVARPTPVALTPETYQHASYFPLASVMTIKKLDARHAAFCLNGVAVYTVETASDIISAGFGNYPVSSSTLTLVDVMKHSNLRPLNGMTGINLAVFGDSITAGDGAQHVYGCWPEQLKANFDGAAGLRIKTVQNYAVPGATTGAQKVLCTSLAIADANIVLALLGTNDIQGGISVASFLSSIGEMIDTCVAAGKPIIFGIPPMFYGMVQASGRGNNTLNYELGAPYRTGLMRLCASRGVKCIDTLGGLGPILATYLDASFSQDPLVYDNVHPSFFGRKMLAQLFGNAILGEIAKNTAVAEFGTLLPTSGLAAGSLFTTEPGRLSLNQNVGITSVSGVIDILSGIADGTIIYTLPERAWPDRSRRFIEGTSVGVTTCLLTVGTTGAIRIYGAPAAGGYVNLEMTYATR